MAKRGGEAAEQPRRSWTVPAAWDARDNVSAWLSVPEQRIPAAWRRRLLAARIHRVTDATGSGAAALGVRTVDGNRAAPRSSSLLSRRVSGTPARTRTCTGYRVQASASALEPLGPLVPRTYVRGTLRLFLHRLPARPPLTMRASFASVLAGFSLLLPLVTAGAPSGVGATVLTDSGPVVGHAAKNRANVSEYLGIPYAQPPLASLRFAAPRRYLSNATFNAAAYVGQPAAIVTAG